MTVSNSDPHGLGDTFEVDGSTFRDLDHDGQLSPYEDRRVPIHERTIDLLGRMTIAEKAGAMLHATAVGLDPELGRIGVGASYDLDAVGDLIIDRHITAFISRLTSSPQRFAEQNNAIQLLAAQTRLGIPVTLSSDPRHHFTDSLGASTRATGFSQWPEPLGLAAGADPDVVRRFGDAVRREYRAVGLHMTLAPQADLATSPRWPRIDGTFGENPELVRRLSGAFVEGVQGGRSGLTTRSVAAVAKHWVGYGASRDGFDGHNWYGRFSAFPSGAFHDHVDAFADMLAFRVAAVMPTYNILAGLELDGVAVEPVGAGFNRQVLTGLLRNHLGFDGVVLSDWAITRNLTAAARTGVPAQTAADIAMPWGVETLSPPERYAKAINAGIDQLGGEDDPDPILIAVEQGLLSTDRVDACVYRILHQKFELGLFDQPFVSVAEVDAVVGTPELVAAGRRAQLDSIAVLSHAHWPPVGHDDRVFLHNLDAAPFTDQGFSIVADPGDATVAVANVDAPHEELHPGYFFGRLQHEGDLDFKIGSPTRSRLQMLFETVPSVVVVVNLDRPAILTEIVARASAVIASFGATPSTLCDVLTGRHHSRGRLPFRLARSMDDVRAQPCDRPDENTPPLFPFGHRAVD